MTEANCTACDWILSRRTRADQWAWDIRLNSTAAAIGTKPFPGYAAGSREISRSGGSVSPASVSRHRREAHAWWVH